MRSRIRSWNFEMKSLVEFGLRAFLISTLAFTLGAGPSKKGRRASTTPKVEAAKAAESSFAKDDSPAKDDPDEKVPTVDVLTGLRTGQLSAVAEGTGDGSVTMSLTNRTKGKLRVVLPPGLIVSGATGQFGGGMGGMGGGMGGMGGGGMGGMGGGMGGMGGGMGGMGGGMGSMGGGMGGGRMGGGTMPASMGMMMLGRLIMRVVGERDSWDQSSIMAGGMMGGGMGGMGGGMGGMGGMGGGMGGMGGGMGGGMRSVPPTGLPQATLNPGQVRNLATPVVSLNGPDAKNQAVVPPKGEKFFVRGIDQATDDPRTRQALKMLAEAKAPQTVSQMVLWYVTAGADWTDIGRLCQGWGNAHEIALARRFVSGMVQSDGSVPATPVEPGVFFFEIKSEGDRANGLAEGLKTLWNKGPVLGLTAREGIPVNPGIPSIASRLELTDTGVAMKLYASHPSGTDWIPLGTYKIKLPSPAKEPAEAVAGADRAKAPTPAEREAFQLGNDVTERMLSRLVRVTLARGPKVKGKDTYAFRILNESPLVLNGLSLGGAKVTEENPPSTLAGLSVPPLKSLTVSGSAEFVSRHHLKEGVRVHAVDLSGL